MCATSSVPHFSAYAPVLGLANFPSLNNSNDALTLRNQNEMLVHSISYSDLWYGDQDKKEGGWSLEMIDLDNPCGESSNWTASVDASGGTPTRLNSVAANKPDLTAPQLISAFIVAHNRIQLTFDEKPDTNTLSLSLFTLDANSITKISFPSNPLQIILETGFSFAAGTLYTLGIYGIKDCNGNSTAQPISITLVMPEEATAGDILINEILFNPKTGGYDFIELYNPSSKYIDLKNWQLANLVDGIISNYKPVFTESFILRPKEYITVTENKSMLLNHYPKGAADRIFQVQDLPSYNDDQGTVVLLKPHGEVQEYFKYSEDYHFALLDDKEGVSLERISLEGLTNNPANWHSASSQSGYATPGYKNSESIENTEGSQVWVEPNIFTPDENGDKDYTLINYKFDTPGNTVNITIFDDYGREMIKLARNELLATEGFYRWDGNNQHREKVRSGAYIVYFELFNLDGEVKKFKEVVVVGWSQKK